MPPPTHRLPIELRRGRRPRRPTSPQFLSCTVGGDAHIAPHGRCKECLCQDGQHKRGARREIRRREYAKARHKVCTFRFAGQKGTDANGTSAAERISKPLVLAAFFPPFLSLQKEREPPEAYDKRHSAESGGGLWSARPTGHKEICTSPVWADRVVRPYKFIMKPYTISPAAFYTAPRCYVPPGPRSGPGPDRP